MIQIIFVFLATIMITAVISFTAGMLTGRIYEKKEVIKLLDRYYSRGDGLNDITTISEKEITQ